MTVRLTNNVPDQPLPDYVAGARRTSVGSVRRTKGHQRGVGLASRHQGRQVDRCVRRRREDADLHRRGTRPPLVSKCRCRLPRAATVEVKFNLTEPSRARRPARSDSTVDRHRLPRDLRASVPGIAHLSLARRVPRAVASYEC